MSRNFAHKWNDPGKPAFRWDGFLSSGAPLAAPPQSLQSLAEQGSIIRGIDAGRGMAGDLCWLLNLARYLMPRFRQGLNARM